MRLQRRHIERLSQLEKRIYASLIGKVDENASEHQRFVSQSQKYVDRDEFVLPFPERSTKGIMLSTLSQALSEKSAAAAILTARIPEFTNHIKAKLLALSAGRVYNVPPRELTAAIYGNNESPFDFYRRGMPLQLKGLPEHDHDIICAINPPPRLVANTDEYEVVAILLKSSEEMGDLNDTPLFAEAAHLGLLQVDDLGEDRLWLSQAADETAEEEAVEKEAAEQNH